MPERSGTAARYIEADRTLEALRDTASGCTACDLHVRATQTVFGEGPTTAQLMLVGEQPGDAEDLAGHPFVGPAGKLLDKALGEAGIDREKVYVTNVVKHYKWIVRGKKRIHQKPNAIQIEACRPWLDAEIDRVSPKVVVALGATAAQTLFGKSFRVTKQRGVSVQSPFAATAMATVHPSSILRITDRTARAEAFDRFVGDLRSAANLLSGAGKRKASSR